MDEPLSAAEQHRLLREGGESAFAEMFTEVRERLEKMLHRNVDPRLSARVDLCDILQDTYLEARSRLQHFLDRPQMSFYAWLRQVTLQRMIDVHRRHLLAGKRAVRSEVSFDACEVTENASTVFAHPLVSRFSSPSQATIREEMMEQVEKSLAELEPQDREILALRHLEDLGNRETAELLGLSEAAASNRYMRALSRLRSNLETVPGFFDGI